MDLCDYSWTKDIYGHALLNVWKIFQEKLAIKNNKKNSLVARQRKKYKVQLLSVFFSDPIPVYNSLHPWKQSKPFCQFFSSPSMAVVAPLFVLTPTPCKSPPSI